jgi:hypothetical protein
VHVYEQLRGELKAIVKSKCDALNDVAALRIIVKQQREIIDSLEESRNFDAFQVKRGQSRLQQQPQPAAAQPDDEQRAVRQWLASALKRQYVPGAPLQDNLDAVTDQMKRLKSELRQCVRSLKLALQLPDKSRLESDTPVRTAASGGKTESEVQVLGNVASGQSESSVELQRARELVGLLQEQLRQRNDEALRLQLQLQDRQQQQHQQHQSSSEHAVQIRFLRESLSHAQQQHHASSALLAQLRRRHRSLCSQKRFLVKSLAYSSAFVSAVRSDCASRDHHAPVPDCSLAPTSRLRACVLVIIAAHRLLRTLSPAPPSPLLPHSQYCTLCSADDDVSAPAASVCAAAACDGATDARSALRVIDCHLPSSAACCPAPRVCSVCN